MKSFFLLLCFFLYPLGNSGNYDLSLADEYVYLPFFGANFSANSVPGYIAGRYAVRGRVAMVVVDAYAALEENTPSVRYIYAETGKKGGGGFWPHRTHKDGYSVDFITPVYTKGKNGEIKDVVLPCNPLTLWGYAVRIDDTGFYEKYHLNTQAMIAHLSALDKSASKYGMRIKRVIFEPHLLPFLKADPSFKDIERIPFMSGKAWFPHDGHYHVDFEKIPG